MILSFFLFVATTLAQTSVLPIRTGIAKLEVGNINYASYSVTYKSSLPDPVYNSLVSISYVQNFNTANGINVNSVCPNATQTGLGCTIKSGNPNQYNNVYISYVVSDVGSLLVGTFTKTFTFTTPIIKQTLNFKPNVDSNFINTGNSLFVNLYPFVAGISTIDGDFSLNIDNHKFDAVTLNITLGVTLTDITNTDVTVIFGYMLFDSSVITVSLYQGLSLTPGNIPQGYIYGIKTIKTAPPPPKRLLQILPFDLSAITKPFQQYLNPQQKAILASVIAAFDAINIYPQIVNSPKVRPNLTAGNISLFYTPTKPSETLTLLLSGSSGRSKLKFTSVQLNSSIFSLVAQLGNFGNYIDTNTTVLQALRILGLFTIVKPPKTQGKVSHRLKTHSHAETIDAAPPMIPKAPTASTAGAAASPVSGIDNNLFNNLFATNGFVVMTAASDIDQIYYYEVDPVQNIPIAGKAAPVFLKSTVTNQQTPVTCNSGSTKVGKQTQVDLLQSKMVVSCVTCASTQVFDANTKSCIPKTTNPATSSTTTKTAASSTAAKTAAPSSTTGSSIGSPILSSIISSSAGK